jgi:voltage-gated potassium channel
MFASPSSTDTRDQTGKTARFTFLWLLIALVATMLLAPLMEKKNVGDLLMHGCFTLVFLTGLMANRQRPWIFRTAIVLALVGVPLGWTSLLSGNLQLLLFRLFVDMVFFAFTAIMILIAILKDHMANKSSILGATCVYLLLGLSWTCAYSALEISALDNVADEPFRFTERQTIKTAQGQQLTAWPQLVYYSFVTMSTLGFGDITPRTPLAQTLTWMQAVFGQLYLVILIARLVSLLPRIDAEQSKIS